MASVANTLCLVVALLLIYQKTATCFEEVSPVQPKTTPQDKNNTSIFNICHWVNCGGGICKKTNLFLYKCICREGYNNRFNSSIFPCIKQKCELEKHCSHQGTPSSNSSPSSPPPPPHHSKNLTDSSKNQAAGLNLRGSSLWLIASLCVSLVPWRLLYI